MKIVKLNSQYIKLALKYLQAGKAVVYPTDTAYGLGVDATNVKAVKNLFKIKERKNQPTHIVVADLKMAKQIAEFNPAAEKLFKKFLPGPLTLILELRIKNRESWKLLSAGTGTIGIRMPDHKVALDLVRKLGKPITTPSANPAGGPAPYSAIDSFRQFSGKKYQPDLYLDVGKLRRQKPSTMVKLIGDQVEILRSGPITSKQIQQALK